MEAELAKARAVLYGALCAGTLLSGPWLGWWTLLPLLVSAVAYELIRPRIATAPRPEHLVAGQVALSQSLIALTVAATGGARRPVLLIAYLPLVPLPARFGPRGVRAGVAFTVVVLGAAVLTDLAALAAYPPPVILTLVGLIGLSAFSDLLHRTEMRQRSEAVMDPLTGLLNRKALDGRFEEVRAQAARSGAPVSVLLLDVDAFKEVNDEHGHGRGDAVLKDLASVVRSSTRSFELIHRLGGDELLVLLPGRSAPAAADLAERLRRDVLAARPGGLPVTVSVGVSTAHGANVEFQRLFDAADRALYEAKQGGRNRVAVAPGRPRPAVVAACA